MSAWRKGWKTCQTPPTCPRHVGSVLVEEMWPDTKRHPHITVRLKEWGKFTFKEVM